MARAALPGRLSWQLGTVIEVVEETSRASSIVLELHDWPGHRAGQHVDVRLTAEDGYQAQRSYSIASAPEDEHLVLTVERLADGEVSPYLVGEVRRYFAVLEPLDRQNLVVVLGRGRQRVAALRLVAVLGGEAHVDVLAGAVSGPVGAVEDDAADPRSLVDQLENRGELPGQSPW